MKRYLALGTALFIGITSGNTLLASAEPITLPEITIYGNAPKRPQNPINFVEIEPVTIYGSTPSRTQNPRGVVTLPETTIYGSSQYNACVQQVNNQRSCGQEALNKGWEGALKKIFMLDLPGAVKEGPAAAAASMVMCTNDLVARRQECGEQHGYPPPVGGQTTYGGETPYGDQRNWLY
jgi:hypothetical protein